MCYAAVFGLLVVYRRAPFSCCNGFLSWLPFMRKQQVIIWTNSEMLTCCDVLSSVSVRGGHRQAQVQNKESTVERLSDKFPKPQFQLEFHAVYRQERCSRGWQFDAKYRNIVPGGEFSGFTQIKQFRGETGWASALVSPSKMADVGSGE